ncbi:MAG: nuclear transport factor 2 family protein [Arenibacterium sp.]
MITPSPELVAVIRRWHKAIGSRDARAIENMLSQSEYLRYQGSADNESWSGPVFRRGFVDHVREIPEFDFEEVSIEAFQSGDIGWAHSQAYLTFGSQDTRELHRFTFVLHVEDGVWRIVQCHLSNNRDNMEKMGTEHHALDSLLQAAREGFHLDQREGLATVMFTDIVNSSAIADLLGDTAWTNRIRHHFDDVADVIAAEQGQLVKSLGDGTMSSFPSARRALQAASMIQRRNADADLEPPLSMRIGIHSGDVIQTDNDFFGTVVNKAARIAAAADGGEIRVSDATVLMAGDRVGAFADPVEMPLKGLSGKHKLYRLDWRV